RLTDAGKRPRHCRRRSTEGITALCKPARVFVNKRILSATRQQLTAVFLPHSKELQFLVWQDLASATEKTRLDTMCIGIPIALQRALITFGLLGVLDREARPLHFPPRGRLPSGTGGSPCRSSCIAPIVIVVSLRRPTRRLPTSLTAWPSKGPGTHW